MCHTRQIMRCTRLRPSRRSIPDRADSGAHFPLCATRARSAPILPDWHRCFPGKFSPRARVRSGKTQMCAIPMIAHIFGNGRDVIVFVHSRANF
jgi:hypothetical protein